MTTTKKSLPKSKSLPTEILDGRTVEGSEIEVVEWVEPVAGVCGREDCGSGPMRVTGGIAICREGEYGRAVYYCTDSGSSKWWNYGAPHGTHERLNLTWRQVPGIGAGCAGWEVWGAFVDRATAVRKAVECVARVRGEI